MANYAGTGRSNYVRVTDFEKAEKIAALYGCQIYRNDDRITFIARTDDGDVHNYFYPTDEDIVDLFKEVTGTSPELDADAMDDELLPDFAEIVAEILRPNEVFIWLHAGAEALHYIDGYAEAINSKKERVTLTLGSIYDSALSLGTEITMATSALTTVTKFENTNSPEDEVLSNDNTDRVGNS